jgi:hypothetical protein
MKFKVLNNEMPEQDLRCPNCGSVFYIDFSDQTNLIMVNDVLLAQCPACKTIEDEPEFKYTENPDNIGEKYAQKINDLIEEYQKMMAESLAKEVIKEYLKEAKMNIKDCTQTKNGTPVKIYEVYEDKVHGAFFNGTEWIICIWRLDGQNVCYDDKYLNLDLSDWKDEIPWDCLRPEIKWVARDKCGQWLGHDGEPIKDGQDGIWCSAGHEIYALDGVKMPQGPADWKEAIARRPE